jgi:hypothetical protein
LRSTTSRASRRKSALPRLASARGGSSPRARAGRRRSCGGCARRPSGCAASAPREAWHGDREPTLEDVFVRLAHAPADEAPVVALAPYAVRSLGAARAAGAPGPRRQLWCWWRVAGRLVQEELGETIRNGTRRALLCPAPPQPLAERRAHGTEGA